MASKNEHTGDLLMSKKASKEYAGNYSKIFGDKKPKRGRYVYDSELKELVPADEYYSKKAASEANSRAENFPAIHFFKGYTSPMTGRVIDSPNKERDELARTGTRIFEGGDQEFKYANIVKKEKKKKQKEQIRGLLQKTRIDLRDGMTPKPNIKLNQG